MWSPVKKRQLVAGASNLINGDPMWSPEKKRQLVAGASNLINGDPMWSPVKKRQGFLYGNVPTQHAPKTASTN